jgi:hypothetical protein
MVAQYLRAGIFALFCIIPGVFFAQKSSTPANKPSNSSAAAPKPSAPVLTPALAPYAVKDTAIAKLFEKQSDIQWVKSFKGRLDDASVVDISLGFDGMNCRGYMSYAKSRIRFRLEGYFDTLSGFQLEERDMSRGLTGFLTGTYVNRRLMADWSNADKTLGARIEAEEVSPGQSLTVNCSDNKWSGRYITRYNNARCDMVLVRSHNGALDGFLWIEADNKTYRLKGDIALEGNYEMEALLPNGKVAGLLQGNIKPGQNTDCNWIGSGEKRIFKFTLKDYFLSGCYEYADYATSYDALYPRTPCSGCNTWLDQQVTGWVTKCKTTLNDKKTALTPANRSTQRASAWAEVACWTENIFSGYFSFSETWDQRIDGLSYNFDLRTGKPITFNELFNKGFDAKTWLADYARRESPKLSAFAADPQYREWIGKEGFPLFTLRRDGLEISTLFHPSYGRQALLIPYESIKPYMRKDNPIADLVK